MAIVGLGNCARAPGFALAAEHQHLGLLVGREPVERVVHVEMQFRTHGVTLVRAVEPQERDPALPFDENVFVFLVSHNVPLLLPAQTGSSPMKPKQIASTHAACGKWTRPAKIHCKTTGRAGLSL
jgi:hypothetical protein